MKHAKHSQICNILTAHARRHFAIACASVGIDQLDLENTSHSITVNGHTEPNITYLMGFDDINKFLIGAAELIDNLTKDNHNKYISVRKPIEVFKRKNRFILVFRCAFFNKNNDLSTLRRSNYTWACRRSI